MSGLSIPRLLVEFILLGPEDDRRQLQDSPILGDVWIKFAEQPSARLHLLITPYKETPAGTVAEIIDDYTAAAAPEADHTIAYLQGIVAATLTFEEVLRYVVPMTSWWCDKGVFGDIQHGGAPAGRPGLRRHMAVRHELAQPGRVCGSDDDRYIDLGQKRRVVGRVA